MAAEEIGVGEILRGLLTDILNGWNKERNKIYSKE
jgi:hypothetical protein